MFSIILKNYLGVLMSVVSVFGRITIFTVLILPIMGGDYIFCFVQFLFPILLYKSFICLVIFILGYILFQVIFIPGYFYCGYYE